MKLTKIVVVALFMALIVMGAMLLKRDDQQYVNPQAGYTPPRQSQPFSRADDPTYAEEVKSMSSIIEAQKEDLTAQINSLKNETQAKINEISSASQKEKDALLAQIKTLQSQLGEQKDNVKQELNALANKVKDGTKFSGQEIEKIIQKATDKINEVTGEKNTEDSTLNHNIGDKGVPVIDITQPDTGTQPATPPTFGASGDPFNHLTNDYSVSNGRVSIRPYGVSAELPANNGGGSYFDSLSGLNPFGSNNNGNEANTSGGGFGAGLSFEQSDSGNPFATKVSAGGKVKYTPIPMFTIPDTSTLVVNAAMTPFIGRVPNRGNAVPDPFRFKLITGADNLATNGLRIPGIDNIVWSGFAVGVRENSCVRGFIDTITYTFQDGRVQTITSGKSRGGNSNQNLGYITDLWGKPCIRGQLISNASDYLFDRGSAAFLAAIAEAAAASQVTVQSNTDGSMSQFITGNTGEFVASKGISGVAKEIADYVRERAANAFDVVYVPSGVEVQIFVERQINIDYDPNGRKIAYDYTQPASNGNGRLD